MNKWTEVRTQMDIDTLLQDYRGFHDSCLVGLNYQSGAFVNEEQFMCFGNPEEKTLHMVFHSQWEKRPLEMCFTGVRCFHIAGWQEHYFNDIFDCCLKICTDLIPGRDGPLFVWADCAGFSPKTALERPVLNEPMISYVIASELKWKFLQE